MQLELGLKLARVADEFTSAEFQIAKDHAGPLFLSRETDTMFILEIHLRGYKKRNINIEINEDATHIVISGEKEIQETLMVGWSWYKKGKEIRGFKKAFKIPDGVILDRIRAKFDEDEYLLRISMPKKEKGIRGVNVEEVKEYELTRGGSGRLQIDDHEKITNEQRDQETEFEYTKENEAAGGRSPQVSETVGGKEPQENVFPEESQKKSIHDVKEQTEIEEQNGEDERLQMVEEDHERVTENIERRKSLPYEATQGFDEQSVVSSGKALTDESKDGLEKEDINQGVRGNMQAEQTTDEDHREEKDMKAGKEEEDEGSAHVQGPEMAAPEAAEEERGRFKICTPFVAGSALFLSIVAFVIHFIRIKSQSGKRKD